MAAKKQAEQAYSVTFYQSLLGLPSLMILERTGTSGLPWGPVISHREQAHCEIIYVMGGTGRIAVQDRWHDAAAHQVFFIPPTVPLDLITQEENKLDLFYAHFHMQNDHHFRRSSGPAPFMLQEIESYNDQAYVTMLALPDDIVLPAGNQVLRYLTTALELYESRVPGYYQETCALLLVALHRLFGALMSTVSEEATGPKDKTLVLARRIRNYISERANTFSGLNELGKAFRMNSQHLSRVFKRAYGEGIVSFANRLRVERAKFILIKTDDNIREVARNSGFKTTNHFQRVFRGVVGLSPLEFRSIRSVESTPPFDFTSSLDRLPEKTS